MTSNDYNIEYLKKEVRNARDKNYFARIESFYRKLPKTDCEKCGKCCYDPPVSTFIEFMYVYELFDGFNNITKQNILMKALKRYFYSLTDKFSEPCCFLDSNNMCLIYQRSCFSCKRWGTYGKEQYEKNWETDSEYNKSFQRFYKEKYNINISDENINARLSFCDKVRIQKNPYRIQENDYQEYLKSLYNAEVKCLEHANMSQNNGWSVNEWLVYFTFGKGIFDKRIELIQKMQNGDLKAVDSFIDSVCSLTKNTD